MSALSLGGKGQRERTGSGEGLYGAYALAYAPYGSFESAPFGHDFKRSPGDRRKAKRGVLDAWPGS